MGSAVIVAIPDDAYLVDFVSFVHEVVVEL
jgi:hypothetical protein